MAAIAHRNRHEGGEQNTGEATHSIPRIQQCPAQFDPNYGGISWGRRFRLPMLHRPAPKPLRPPRCPAAHSQLRGPPAPFGTANAAIASIRQADATPRALDGSG